MKTCFSAEALQVIGRQSELIEFALTYKFDAIDVNIDELHERTQRTSFEGATRYLTSAGISVHFYDLAIDFDCDDSQFEKYLATAAARFDLAEKIGAVVAIVAVPAMNNQAALPEFFKTFTARVERLSELANAKKQQIALRLNVGAEQREDKEYNFAVDVANFLAVYNACKSDRVGMFVDISQWEIGGGNIEQFSGLELSEVFGVRLSTLPEGNRDEVRSDQTLLPGESEVIDVQAYYELLKERSFAGYLSVGGLLMEPSGVSREVVVDRAVKKLRAIQNPELVVELPEENAEADEDESAVATAS